MMILLFTTNGCAACEAAIPEFEAWRAAHPLDMALVLDANGPYPTKYKVKIKATPTYAVVDSGEILAKHDSAMTAKQLDRWLRSVG